MELLATEREQMEIFGKRLDELKLLQVREGVPMAEAQHLRNEQC